MVAHRERARAIAIEQPRLLLVEGRDEYWFFRRIIDERKIEGIQIVEFHGKDGLGNFLTNILVPAIAPPDTVVGIGVVRDADESYSQAFQSVGDSLRLAGLPVPLAPLAYAEGLLYGAAIRVVAYVMPDNSSRGDLEALCLNAVSQSPAMPCVDSYLSCLRAIEHLPRQESKARLRAFLSANPDNPNLLIGQALAAGVIPWDSPAFAGIHQFLDILAAVG